MNFKKTLDLLCNRPLEPTFCVKGDRQSKFVIPQHFYTNQYKDVAYKLTNRFTDANAKEHIQIDDISSTTIPNLKFTEQIKKYDMFTPYLSMHRKIANKLIDLFIKCKTIKDLESMTVYCRDRINSYLFVYALNVALINRDDTKEFLLPTYLEMYPEKFIDGQSYQQARAEITVVPDGSRIPVALPIESTGTHSNFEQRCAYFREDFGINLLYWNWNVRYPIDAQNINMINKNRRGELFYYLHQQLLARYNCERLSNKLYRTNRLNNLREEIAEGYFPKLNTQSSSQSWPPRFDYTKLQDLKRTNVELYCDVSELERWIVRICDSIDVGYVISDDPSIKRIHLSDKSGIDCLGNIIQSTMLSPNKNYYGSLATMGHLLIAYVHDPDERHLETFGVMGDPATTVRDPVFYRWHSTLLDIFQKHKQRLLPYTKYELDYQDIELSDVEIELQNKQDGLLKNTLQTFWQQTDVDISRGLDFTPKGHIYVRITHLQHSPFTYRIKVKNVGNALKAGTIRIFMAPKYDERGELFTFREQRLLMIELDRFVTQLRPGINFIIRRSTESQFTIQMDHIFSAEKLRTEQLKTKNKFCDCGWPHHMLIPKGNDEGMEYVLFVMVSQYNSDYVDPLDEDKTSSSMAHCYKGSSMCGELHDKYPDARPMGYPFDRLPIDDCQYLTDFLYSNMKITDVRIQFLDKTVEVSKDVPSTGSAAAATTVS